MNPIQHLSNNDFLHSPEGSTFGARLRLERDRLGMSQTSLARHGGVTKGTQINYESGKRSPGIRYLQEVLVVGVDVFFVLYGLHVSQSFLLDCQGAVAAELDASRRGAA